MDSANCRPSVHGLLSQVASRIQQIHRQCFLWSLFFSKKYIFILGLQISIFRVSFWGKKCTYLRECFELADRLVYRPNFMEASPWCFLPADRRYACSGGVFTYQNNISRCRWRWWYMLSSLEVQPLQGWWCGATFHPHKVDFSCNCDELIFVSTLSRPNYTDSIAKIRCAHC